MSAEIATAVERLARRPSVGKCVDIPAGAANIGQGGGRFWSTQTYEGGFTRRYTDYLRMNVGQSLFGLDLRIPDSCHLHR